MTTIKMDISRCCGEGFREIREWLLRVMALRLKTFWPNNSSGEPSLGTADKRIWREASGFYQSLSDLMAANCEMPSSPSTETISYSDTAEHPLHTFRRIFKKMSAEVDRG